MGTGDVRRMALVFRGHSMVFNGGVQGMFFLGLADSLQFSKEDYFSLSPLSNLLDSCKHLH